MVSVMDAVVEEKFPLASCVAVITVEPKARGVITFPTKRATAGLEEVKVHAPVEFEVGAMRERLATLSFIMVTLPKGPSTGLSALTVRVIVVETETQLRVCR